MNYTLEKNHQCVLLWQTPIKEGFDINENKTFFTLKKGEIEYINVGSKQQIFEIERTYDHSLEIIIRVAPEFFEVDSTYDFYVQIEDKNGENIFKEEGTISIIQQESIPMDMDIQTTRMPWDAPVFQVSFVGEEISSQRISVCQSCPFYQDDTCMQCGCYMPEKVKTSSATCPIGLW